MKCSVAISNFLEEISSLSYLKAPFSIMNENVNEVGIVLKKDGKQDYVDYLISTIDNKNIPFKVAIDTANGASFETAQLEFHHSILFVVMVLQVHLTSHSRMSGPR